MHNIDETVDYFFIDTYNNFLECDFSDFLSLLSFQSQEFNLKTQYYFKYILNLLGNEEEQNKIHVNYIDILTTDNIIDLILRKPQFFPQNEFIL